MTHIPAPPTRIELVGVSKAYPSGVQVLQGIDLTTRQGGIFGIIGRSSVGKSTPLRPFNRLENADSGKMFIHGESTMRYSTHRLHDLRRRAAMIFQHFNLMATKTVAQNIALPLKMTGVLAGERQRRVSEMFELMGLSVLRDGYPARLSGGQKQRTGIARAPVTQPGILLCDEVISALDLENTLSVLTLLKEINQCLGLTIVLITHEMEVIRILCDRISVLEGGRIVEQGDVWRVFGSPQHPVTRAMLGLQHPDRSEVRLSLRDGEQIVILCFDGSSGCEPNLQHITSLLRGDARLLYSNCGRIQDRVIGQLQVQLSRPLVASTLAQNSWVADSILAHRHWTVEITASQPSNRIIFPILC